MTSKEIKEIKKIEQVITENEKNEALEKIKKARVRISLNQPFFAYLCLYLKFIEDNKINTMGVSIDGKVYYNVRFINKLNISQLEGVIIHEVLHLSMRHLLRLGNRNLKGFNLATDLSINHIIANNGMELPRGALLPNYKDEFDFNGYIIKEVSKKFAEQIYDELYKEYEKRKEKRRGKGKKGEVGDDSDSSGDSNSSDNGGSKKNKRGKWNGSFEELFGDYDSVDVHIYTNGLTATEKEKFEKEWRDKLAEAITSSKMTGRFPMGMERIIDEFHKEKIDWRSALNKYVTNMIPFSQCYSKPHKRSRSLGVYLPHQKKESIEIGVMVDLSGSVDNKGYSDFVSEIIGIAKAYQERITFHFYSHDTKGYYNGAVTNGNIEKIKQIKMKGGGGTCFNEPSKFITEHNRRLKAVIWLTDGYGTDIKNKTPYDILWVLDENGSDEICKKYGRVIKLN